ncbi:hypothetical protein NP493_135g01009 [Ridgeia piscesae]|uniref:Uncharacterized protein n=1 Tax=Ridgeia piscesae TaxID=27915 RepID=A0AAD9UGC4_RIDPI|nr:hypothetical protein NP493_135g01009 [Ridgeia piscesae]
METSVIAAWCGHWWQLGPCLGEQVQLPADALCHTTHSPTCEHQQVPGDLAHTIQSSDRLRYLGQQLPTLSFHVQICDLLVVIIPSAFFLRCQPSHHQEALLVVVSGGCNRTCEI